MATGNVDQANTANTPSLATAATALASNDQRRGFLIQNQDDAILYVLLGSGASTSVYHVALKACTVAKDGTGGSYEQMGPTVYTGIITIAPAAGDASYTVLEL